MVNKIKLTTVIIILIGFAWLPFIICSYFNFAQHDDLYNHAWLQEKGILGTAALYVKNHDGRYITNFIGLVGLQFKFLLNNYYLYFILFQAIYIVCIYKIIGNIFNYFAITVNGKWLTAIIINILCMLLMFETSTAYYWATSLFSYQLGVLFMLYFLSLLPLYNAKRCSVLQKIILGFGCITLIGFHELIWALCLACIAMWFVFCIAFKLQKNKIIFFALPIFIFGIFTLIFLNVLGQTNNEYINKSNGYKIAHTITQSATLFILLFQKPLFWLALFVAFLFGNKYGEETKYNYNKLVYLLVAGFIIAIGVIAVPHIFGMGVPNRVLNILTNFLIFYWGTLCFYLGLQTQPLRLTIKPLILFILGFVFICTNNNFIDAIKSVPTGYLYQKFNNSRVAAIKTSTKNNITLKPLDTLMQQYLQVQPNKIKKIFDQKIGTKPTTQFFDDDLTIDARIGTYAQYYGIDSITVNGITKPRFGITDKR